MVDKKPKSLVEKGNSAPKRQEEPKAQSLTPEQQAKQVADFEKIKNKLESLKKSILKKYSFIMAIGLLPINAAALFEEDEGLPKEAIETKPLHLMIIIPEDNYKEIPKIKPEIVKIVKETKENI